jgi:proline dehydrogenase
MLDAGEVEEWKRVKERFRRIGEAAATAGIGFLIDAEETWIQDPVDALTMLMMDEFNKERLVIYNTVQLYRHDRLDFLKKCYEAALERNFLLGVKLVRGAYRKKSGQELPRRVMVHPFNRQKKLRTGIITTPYVFASTTSTRLG